MAVGGIPPAQNTRLEMSVGRSLGVEHTQPSYGRSAGFPGAMSPSVPTVEHNPRKDGAPWGVMKGTEKRVWVFPRDSVRQS